MKSLTHEKVRYYLHSGDEYLSAAEHTVLEQHLAECPECRRYTTELATLQASLSRIMQARWNRFSPSPNLTQQVQTRLRSKMRQSQTLNFAGSLGTTTLLIILVVALGWLVWHVRPALVTPASPTAKLATPSLQSPNPLQTGNWPALPGLVTFGGRFKLLGYTVDNYLAPNSVAQVALFWQSREITATYNTFVHVFDANGQLVAQTELPVIGDACTRLGQFSEGMFVACYAIPVNIPPGQYQLGVGLYNPVSGERLTTDTGEAMATLTIITVGEPPVQENK